MGAVRNLYSDRHRILHETKLAKNFVPSQTTHPISPHPSHTTYTSIETDEDADQSRERVTISWSSVLEHDGFRSKAGVLDTYLLITFES